MKTALAFVERETCALCGARDHRPVARRRWRDLELRWVGCRSCSLVFMDPAPSAEAYVAFYREDFWDITFNPYHPYVYSPATLAAMLEKHGLAAERRRATPPPGRYLPCALWRWWGRGDPHLAVLARPADAAVPIAVGDLEEVLARRARGQRAAAVRGRLRGLGQRLRSVGRDRR